VQVELHVKSLKHQFDGSIHLRFNFVNIKDLDFTVIRGTCEVLSSKGSIQAIYRVFMLVDCLDQEAIGLPFLLDMGDSLMTLKYKENMSNSTS